MLVLLQLVRTESALEIAEERAGSLEDALAETTVVAGEEKAKMDQELFLLKRRMDGVTGAKEAAADSMAALKQSAAEERAGKFAAEAALQAVRFLRTDLSAGLLLLLVLLLLLLLLVLRRRRRRRRRWRRRRRLLLLPCFLELFVLSHLILTLAV